MIEQVEIEGQLSMFEMDETKNKLYEVLEANNYNYEIQSYYMHNDYRGYVKYFYARTTDNEIIDLCLSDFPEVFAIHKDLSDIEIKNIFKGRL
ncbi:hypothetical protein [Bacillus sp. FSL R9-9410]|uniref:hypothetical protein n=1 Tax=Bacillus sp. FSL R9-9410 TaxID=2921590 RepID=UPI003100D9DD